MQPERLLAQDWGAHRGPGIWRGGTPTRRLDHSLNRLAEVIDQSVACSTTPNCGQLSQDVNFLTRVILRWDALSRMSGASSLLDALLELISQFAQESSPCPAT